MENIIISVEGYEYKIKFVNPISEELNDRTNEVINKINVFGGKKA